MIFLFKRGKIKKDGDSRTLNRGTGRKKVNKIIWKSILATLASTLILCGVLTLSCVCFFPPTVMEFAYSVGWDKTAMKYAQKSYERFGESYYAAYAMEIAADLELHEKTERYAEALISCGDFDAFCLSEDARVSSGAAAGDNNLPQGSYRQYVYVRLCLAKYRLNKADEAIKLATSSLGGTEGAGGAGGAEGDPCREFPPNNALAAVLLYALNDGDTQTVSRISAVISSIDDSALGESDKEYLAAMKNLIVQNATT